ncbi:MAG: hypothetical protein K6B65_02765 [Bacilli bacterium]|nr:hypothetical protein [Bacilli bacterium]
MGEEDKKNPLIPDEDEPLSEAMQKEKEKTQIPVSGKHMLPRIIIFVLLLLVGIAGITLSFLGVFSTTEGIREIEYNAASIPLEKTIKLYYEFSGNSFAVSQEANAVKTEYSSLYYASYSNYEEETVYSEPYSSIGAINASLDKTMTVNSAIYDALKDAYSRSSASYSIFAGPIEDFWNFCLKTGGTNDPLTSNAGSSYLSSFVSLLNEDKVASIDFLENGAIKVSEKSEYKAWKEEYEYKGPLLSLGYLKDAYRMDAIKKGLVEKGFTKGYLLDIDTGTVLSLGESGQITATEYALTGTKPVEAMRVKLEKGSCLVSVRHFAKSSIDLAYTINSEGKTHYRSGDINPSTGVPSDELTFLLSVTSNGAVSSVNEAIKATRGEIGPSSLQKVVYQEKGDLTSIFYSSSLSSSLTFLDGDEANFRKEEIDKTS